jgi:hypothetical protein
MRIYIYLKSGVMKSIKGFLLVKLLIVLIGISITSVGYAQHPVKCDEDDDNKPPKPPKPDPIKIPVVHGVDPNIIEGPQGYDTVRWVSAKEVLNYKILFENDPEFATGPVQTLSIYHPLDENVDPSTFRLGSFGFGKYVFPVPENKATYSARLDLIDSMGIYIDVLAGVDFVERQAFWIFTSIDPTTGLPPEDAFKGFLPVNDTTTFYNDTIPKKGEGFVNYSIRCAGDVKTGDSVKAQAGIVFDFNAPVITNKWINIIDAVAPVSKLKVISHQIDPDVVTLNFSGEDDSAGVGIKNYDLYVSENGQPFYLYQEKMNAGEFHFMGNSSGKYCFFSTARDFVNNQETTKSPLVDCMIFGEIHLVNVKSILEGAYNKDGLMFTTLNQAKVLPLAQPYNTEPWFYKGQEKVDTMPDNIVDWVLVSLRTHKSKDSVVSTTAALLRNDGQVVGVYDSLPKLTVPNKTDSFYVSVIHRNHLAIMSAKPLSDTSMLEADFTRDVQAVYGNQNAVKDLGGGYYGMFSGDVDANGQVQNIDVNIVLPTLGMKGYRKEDTDLNSEVQSTDIDNKISPDKGRGEQFEK